MVAPAVGAALIGGASNALMAGFGGGDEQKPQKMHSRWSDPYQGALFQQQMKRGLSGAGDFGFGTAAKQGQSQLAQYMADRGISGQSGVGLAAQGNMLSQAMGADIANRRNWLGNLMSINPNKERSEAGFTDYSAYGRWGEPYSLTNRKKYASAPGSTQGTVNNVSSNILDQMRTRNWGQ